jgi:hypothetical protein
MQIKDSRFHKCWEIEDKGNVQKIKFGDSKKNQDGTYKNCTWSGILVGKAKDVKIKKDDVFTINSGIVFQEKFNDKWYTNVTIFDIDVTSYQGPEDIFSEFSEIEDDDIPF